MKQESSIKDEQFWHVMENRLKTVMSKTQGVMAFSTKYYISTYLEVLSPTRARAHTKESILLAVVC